MGEEETERGARNRANAASELWRERHGRRPEFAVGLEGGVGEHVDARSPSTVTQHACFAWMAVLRTTAARPVRYCVSSWLG